MNVEKVNEELTLLFKYLIEGRIKGILQCNDHVVMQVIAPQFLGKQRKETVANVHLFGVNLRLYPWLEKSVAVTDYNELTELGLEIVDARNYDTHVIVECSVLHSQKAFFHGGDLTIITNSFYLTSMSGEKIVIEDLKFY